LAVLAVAAVGSALFWYSRPADLIPGLAPPSPSLSVFDRYGLPMGSLLSSSESYSMPVSLESLSPWLILATIATEDKRYYFHSGVDFQAVLRALWQNVSRGRVVSGASTLTEQLARALEPYPKTFWGKAREALLARSLEKQNSKRDILETYFNTISYGNQCQGVEAASRRYLGLHCSNLSLAQAAYLAAIPKSPVRYNPFRFPGQVLERQKKILDSMKEKGWVDDENWRLAQAEAVQIQKPSPENAAPHFMSFLKDHADWDRERVETTFDLSLQTELQELLSSQLKRLKNNHVTNGAMLVVDTATGGVLAWVGSADFGDASIQGQVDGVRALRQPGSSLKPFLYGLAFSRGMKTSDLLLDEPTYTEGGFIPRNYDDQYHGFVRMRTALACSYNVPAIRLAEKVSVVRFLEFLHECGFSSLSSPPDHYGLGLALGDGEITLLESATAYAALARGGIWKPLRVLKGREPDLLSAGEEPRWILDSEEAYLVTSILSDNTARSGAFGLYSPLLLPFPFAAKTGTTKDYRDNWAVGYTPEWVVAVWVGNFDGTPMRHVSGITGAAPLLHDAAMLLSKKYPPSPFTVPSGIVEKEVCSISGDLPSADCPNRITEVFDSRFIPTTVCKLHQRKTNEASSQKDSILFPRQGDVFKINPAVSLRAQSILLQARSGMAGNLYWKVDGKSLMPQGGKTWWNLRPGKHQVGLWLSEGVKKVCQQTVFIQVVP